MDPLTLMLVGGLISGLLGNAAQNRQERFIRQQQDEAQRRYQENYERLANMLAGILDPNYSAISPEMVNQVVARAAEDIGRMQTRANEQALRDLARRGLAGSSLVDQRQAYIGERAADALADARLRAELEAQNLTAAQQAQARNLLAGLTSENFAASQQAAQNLLGSLGQSANTYAALAGTLLAPGLEQWLYPGDTRQPASTDLPNWLMNADSRDFLRTPTVVWS